MGKLKTTGKYSLKPYQCSSCGAEKEIGTNHWGECYPYCSICMEQTVWKCLDPVPEGYTTPKPWKTVKLSDILKIETLSIDPKTHVLTKIREK